MDVETFQALPVEEVARLIGQRGPQVCALPFNGTRRWFLMNQGALGSDDYLEVAAKKTVEITKLIFDHGVTTLLSPILGKDIVDRGQSDKTYAEILHSYSLLATSPTFLDFFATYGVRVGFYGDFRARMRHASLSHVIDAYETLVESTRQNDRYRIFWGLFANDPIEQVARIVIDFHRERGRAPDRREIVSRYYGDYIAPIDIFIGSDRPSVYDVPLLSLGSESLYFTVAPSFCMDRRLLRSILYDHMYARQVIEHYNNVTPAAVADFERFYEVNRYQVLGVGRLSKTENFWYPVTRIETGGHT